MPKIADHQSKKDSKVSRKELYKMIREQIRRVSKGIG
jgi:hypothetical protein